jgi:carbonic anhydrase/acetyltransferase-like protein (isoleucine patch superfamily)
MLLEFSGKYPKIDSAAFLAQNATVIRDLEIGPNANI